jgi:hypothetical protein
MYFSQCLGVKIVGKKYSPRRIKFLWSQFFSLLHEITAGSTPRVTFVWVSTFGGPFCRSQSAAAAQAALEQLAGAAAVPWTTYVIGVIIILRRPPPLLFAPKEVDVVVVFTGSS